MSNVFTQFLSGFAGGIFSDTGYLRDYKHAARLYQDNYYGMAPKAGWSYFVEIGINPIVANKISSNSQESAAWYGRSKGKIGLLVKNADLPKFTIQTESLNQYNKKSVVQTKLNYNPLSITFHDDMDNIITNFWKNYYQYYFADSRYSGFNSLSKGTGSIPASYSKFPDTKWSDRGYAYGLNNSQNEPFLTYIKIFLLNRQRYNSVTLINPIITEWTHGQVDQNQGNKLLDSRMTVSFETVYYDTSDQRVTKSKPGFNEVHYDNSPSPLSAFGRGKKGLLGAIDGASDILGVLGKDEPLSVGDIINVAVGTKNLIKNVKSITGAGARQELYGAALGAFAGAARGEGALGQQLGDFARSPINSYVPVQAAGAAVLGAYNTANRLIDTFSPGVPAASGGPSGGPSGVPAGWTPATSGDWAITAQPKKLK